MNFALLVFAALLLGALGFKAANWAAWRLFPPSLAGSWTAAERADLPISMSLIVTGQQIEGLGSVGSAAFEAHGAGSWKAFDLRLKFEGATIPATGFMLDRDAILIELRYASKGPMDQILRRRE